MTATPKRGPGRPTKPARERRDHQIALRLTTAELRDVERKATRAGQTVSEYIRGRLLDDSAATASVA